MESNGSISHKNKIIIYGVETRNTATDRLSIEAKILIVSRCVIITKSVLLVGATE